jgi:hypothetical protein
MCRDQAGEPDGLVDLQEALRFCRAHQLPSLRRATQNVAYALREEGDRVRSDNLLVAGGPVEITDAPGSGDAIQALLAGDWDHFFALADTFLDTPTAEWNLQIRGVRGWMRALRGDHTGAAQDAALALTTARSSGFWRLKWTALAHGALCHALLDQRADSEAMLRELGEGWRRMRTIASGEWVAAAAHAAVRLGEDAAVLLRDALGDAPHHTAWSRAALSSVDGALASARGDLTAAAAAHLDAAERYAAVGSVTDRIMAFGGAIRALSTAALPRAATSSAARPRPTDPRRADPRLAVARQAMAEFAARNHITSPL